MYEPALDDHKSVQPNTGSNMSEDVQQNGGEFEDDLEPEDMYVKDRRRAKSLPAYPEQASLFNEISQNCRKRVKFADALGLNLASVKHFSTTEDPEIPSTVLNRLKSFPPQQDREFLSDLCGSFKSTLTMNRLIPTFKMPVESRDFETRVKQYYIALENITITEFDVRGQIRALILGSTKKEVGVRYTFNEWLSFVDAQAIPLPSEDNVVGERFSFTMYTPPFLDPNAYVHFAVYSRTDDCEFWDNNEGKNYSLKYQCLSPFESTPLHTT
ncbi:protein phosphatase 1 regulatory subunit 3G [Chanos chanos]|uniref:Protein phosphatase 1 regulatory subunit 3G n=1 Tax=Chanos chanos TaxID=29144 RepID=A0A6J2V0C3_CHACN|nr:protein phosphatase 1 regulatory subunit 3G [Chanos chanos]